MKQLLILFCPLLLFACRQNRPTEKLITKDFKYSAYSWYLGSDTPNFYLAHYLDIDKNGHFSLMRHHTFLDSPNYFTGDLPNTLRRAINGVFSKDSFATDYLIKPEETFIYDGLTYCFDYKKGDSIGKKIQFVPNKSPEQIKQLSLMLDSLIYDFPLTKRSKFSTEEYSKQLSQFPLQTSRPFPKLEKPNIEIKNEK
jgi:hypothetical protein